jgi:glyoxylase-like metal-dependent hydrolase (beta-lactamase superfamily II)
MSVTLDIISIGTLSRNLFWQEKATTRPAHATTTLIRDEGLTLLVDPGLPVDLIRHRLDERAGLKPEHIDAVFLTNFSPIHRRGLTAFKNAEWYISAAEHEAVSAGLNSALAGGAQAIDEISLDEIQQELELLGRCHHVPDRISDHVTLFPAHGATPGSSALLVEAARTLIVAGDAIVTRDHFIQGRIWERSTDPAAARDAFREIYDIAEAIVPGHDNIFVVS